MLSNKLDSHLVIYYLRSLESVSALFCEGVFYSMGSRDSVEFIATTKSEREKKVEMEGGGVGVSI